MLQGLDALCNVSIKYLGSPPDSVRIKDRLKYYTRMARDILAYGCPGSSAAGEQLKFLATLVPSRRYVIVKFSPPLEGSVARRLADLLICEHLALKVIRDSVASSSMGHARCPVSHRDRPSKLANQTSGFLLIVAIGDNPAWTFTWRIVGGECGDG